MKKTLICLVTIKKYFRIDFKPNAIYNTANHEKENFMSKSEDIKKGDVKSKLEEDIELIIDPEKEKESSNKRKNYGTKLVDSGGCPGLV